MPFQTIKYDPNGGAISLDVTPKYATLGKYKILFYKDGSFTEIDPTDPRNLGDDVPDVHTLHPIMDDPSQYVLIVRGNYMPAPNHQQVNVVYTFRQDPHPGNETDDDIEVLHTSEVEDTLTDRSFQTYSYRYELTPNTDESSDD